MLWCRIVYGSTCEEDLARENQTFALNCLLGRGIGSDIGVLRGMKGVTFTEWTATIALSLSLFLFSLSPNTKVTAPLELNGYFWYYM